MSESTPITPAPVAAVVPTPEEVDAAVRTLMRAWSPDTLLPGDPGYDDPEYDYWNDCGCGGTDEDDEPICNCGGGCVCESCDAFQWQQEKHCHWRTSPDVPWCGATARFRVVRFGLVEQQEQDTSPDAACRHPKDSNCWCTPGCVYVEAGPHEQVYQTQSACSVAHAVMIRDAWRAPDVYGSADRALYRIDRWTYRPHHTELPEPLAILSRYAQDAVGGLDHVVRAHTQRRDVEFWMRRLRQDLAGAVRWAAEPWPDPHEDGSDQAHGPDPDPVDPDPGLAAEPS